MSDPREIRDIITRGSSLIREVRIYEQSWSSKVAIDHSDVPYEDVVKTIQDPCMITESKTQPGSYVLLNQQETNVLGHPLRVPVKMYSDGTGTFKSAYYAAAKSHGKVVWNRGDG